MARRRRDDEDRTARRTTSWTILGRARLREFTGRRLRAGARGWGGGGEATGQPGCWVVDERAWGPDGPLCRPGVCETGLCRDGCIAQLVEQLTLNQRVAGSSPATPTKAFSYLRSFSNPVGRNQVPPGYQRAGERRLSPGGICW